MNAADDQDRWLAANTVNCVRLHAKISRQQCGLNITDGLPQCSDCPEAKRAVRTEDQKPRKWTANLFRQRRKRKK